MLELVKDEFDESPEDILKTINKMLEDTDEENKNNTNDNNIK